MGLIIKEIKVKSALTKSGIPGADYCINPYVGCTHGCRYCYATFIKRFTNHAEPWGSFVDVKINAAEVLEKQLKRAARGSIIISSVTDPYQPIEARYKITRKCLEVLLQHQHQFSVDILTKSPIVLRDMDLIKRFKNIYVGITITTDDDGMRKVFESNAPSISARIYTLRRLHENGIETYAFIGPVLPMSPETLIEKVKPYADSIIIDRMNYASKTVRIYRQLKLEKWLDDAFIENIIYILKKGFAKNLVSIC